MNTNTIKLRILDNDAKMRWMEKRFGQTYFDFFGGLVLKGHTIQEAIEISYNHFFNNTFKQKS